MKPFVAAVALLIFSTIALAQPAPGGGDRPPPPGDQPGGPGGPGGAGRPDGPGPRRPDGPGGGFGGGGGGGGGFGRMQGPPGGGPPPQMMVMQRYMELVNQYSRMSSDAQSSGIAAVIAASDILKPRGADAAIQWFNKVLPEVKNPAVRRAIRGQLADLYKQAGQADKALDELQALMTEASSEAPATPPANR